jgi:hypothetical protein
VNWSFPDAEMLLREFCKVLGSKSHRTIDSHTWQSTFFNKLGDLPRRQAHKLRGFLGGKQKAVFHGG